MSVALQLPYTPEQYLAVERLAAERSEYVAGETFNMAGATRRHNLVSGNVFSELRLALRGGTCEVYLSEMKVLIPEADAYVYPDVVVACGELEFLNDREDVLLNPSVVVEVLSPSTEAYDRGAKAGYYHTLESLNDHLLVSQEEARVTHYRRGPEGWIRRDYTGLDDVIQLSEPGLQLTLAAAYEGVTLDASD